MAKIKFSELRQTMADHQKELAKQIEAGKTKLKTATDPKEIARITKELECRVKSKTALDGMVTIAPLTCCDQFFDCPDI